MRKTYRILALLTVAVLLLAMVPFGAFAKSTALKGKTIVAFGDSLTRFGTTTLGGTTTSSTGAYTYPYYLGTDDYLGTAIINAGVGGNTTGHARARFEADVLSQNPDLVIMCFGMNDQAMQTTTGEPLTDMATYRANLIYMAETLKAQGSDVVFVTPNPVNTNSGYYTTISYNLDYAGGYLDDFCNIMREVAIQTECTLVDINYECAFEDMNKFAAAWDGIHHSDYGRRQYASYISKHLEAVYDGTNKATMTLNCVDEKGKTIKTVNFVGASGAHFTIASPVIRGYSPITEDIQTTFVNGKTFTMTYSFDLNSYVEEALSINALDYNEVIINELRAEVAKAQELMKSDDATEDQLVACSNKISSLLAVKGKGEFVASYGKSYEVISNTPHVNYPDNGIRLTDGIIGKDGGSNHSGWTDTVEIIVDLDDVTATNTYRVFAAGGQWGVTIADAVSVYYSNDGEVYTEIGTDNNGELVNNTITWDGYSFTVTSEENINARYIKFVVDPPYVSFVWLSEVQASLAVGEPLKASSYINKINAPITSGTCAIFTPAIGTITADNANHVWTVNVIATWNEEKQVYVVDQKFRGTGKDNTPEITLNENQIMIAAHDWESGVDSDAVLGSAANTERFFALNAGDEFVISGIDVENSTLGVAPYAYFPKLDVEEEIKSGKVENTSSFFVSHFNNSTLEGVGVIFTEKTGGSAWWISVAFAPVAGYDNVYEIVEKSDGTSGGTGLILNVPDGGFVYSANYGNDYPALYASNPTLYAAYADSAAYPNYTNAHANAAVTAAKSWNVGDKFVIDGVDFENKTIPTTTPTLNWFESGYTCTATINVYANDAGCDHNYESVVTDPTCTEQGFTTHTCTECGDVIIDTYVDEKGHVEGEWELMEDGSQELHCSECDELLDSKEPLEGDVNADGIVDMFDYVIVKNIYFEKYTPTDVEFAKADVTTDGIIDIFDYLQIKTIILK